MSKNRQRPKPIDQAGIFFKESKSTFDRLYRETKQPYVLMARNILEGLVDQGMVTPQEALSTLHNPTDFSTLLLTAEQKYKDQEDQKVHMRMVSLERNTDWKAAAAVSLGAGMVTGLVFAVAGPFFSSWLQPTADELFKHTPAAQAPAAPVSEATPTTTQNIYNFYPQEAKPSGDSQTSTKSQSAKVTCQNVTATTYQATLSELLSRGNVVTIETNSKKVSLCYRPSAQRSAQPQTLIRQPNPSLNR